MYFHDRAEAGDKLADELMSYRWENTAVLALSGRSSLTLLRHQHVGIGQHTQRVQVRLLPGVVHPGGAAGGPDIGMVGQ